MTEHPKPDHQLWTNHCEGYVFRRHMLPSARWTEGRLLADACEGTASVKPDEALKWIYELLSAMDSKASALMRLNGVMLAAAAFLLSAQGAGTVLHAAKWDQVAVAATAALSALSILLCLYVVNVSWYFLGRVSDSGGKMDYTTEFKSLQNTAKLRQMVYRLAWKVSLVAALVFVVQFAHQALYIIWGI